MKFMGAEMMGKSGKCLFCKPEDLTWILRTHVKQLGVMTHNFRVGEVKTGRSLELTSQPT